MGLLLVLGLAGWLALFLFLFFLLVVAVAFRQQQLSFRGDHRRGPSLLDARQGCQRWQGASAGEQEGGRQGAQGLSARLEPCHVLDERGQSGQICFRLRGQETAGNRPFPSCCSASEELAGHHGRHS